MTPPRRRFYGWPLVVVGWLLYGFGVMPFYSWGFFLPEMIGELSLSRADGGLVFGVGTFCGGVVAPLVGIALTRFGLRRVMTAGFAVSAIGYALTSRATNMWELIAAYGVFAASTHAFATVLPIQTLASTWFLRYRSRVMAVLLTAGGVLAPLIYAFDTWLLGFGTWRTGWVVIGGVNLVLAVASYLLLRDSPESVGQLQDGARDRETLESYRPKGESAAVDRWTASKAIRTPQFALMVVCGLGYVLPWYVLNNHSRLHLQDLGFEITAVAAILSSMALVSTVGRLTGALGDFVSPPRLLALALVLEAVGTGLFLVATTPARAYVSVILVGLGFGMAYISQATTFALFFGRRAFATTTGLRFMIGAFFTASVPALAGWTYDARGSYAIAFLGLMVLSLAAAVVAFFLRAPEPPAAEAS